MGKSNKKNDEDLSREEKLRMENEIEKLKLSALHDAKFFSSNKDLPPEVENEWLKYIAHFEKEWEEVERITVAAKLGCPKFPAVETLGEQEIEQKLDEVQRRMAGEGIFLDVLTEVPATEIYRFITEELFEHEIDDVNIEGMQTVFIYEEFYPDDKLDMEQAIENFIFQLFDEQFHNMLTVADECKTATGKSISGKRAIEKAIAFTKLYDQFELDILNNYNFNIDEPNDTASASFDISYEAITEQENNHFEGKATALMAKGDLGYWNIKMLEMPGLAF